jgi:predicted AlkP superfamily phosphohydrolase/phosphomutase
MDRQVKVLVIGLDGGTLDVLRPWVDEGHLPTLRRLMAGGAVGGLHTTMPPVTASAWTSFATGKNPSKHGLVDFIFLRDGRYDISVVNSTHRDGKCIWNIVSDSGRRVVVVGVPTTYPPEEVNGYMVSGFMTPSAHSEYTYPPTLKEELHEEIGEFPLAPSEKRRFGKIEHFLEDMKLCARKRTDTALYLMRKGSWDFFAIVYSSTDMVQHELWHLLDEKDRRYDPAVAASARDVILDFYGEVDACMGRLIAEAGQDTLVIVMSDHGFGPTYNFFHANNWLHRIGMLKFKRRPINVMKYALFRLGFTPLNALKLLTLLGLGRLRENMKSGKGHGLLSRLFLSYQDIDWSRSKAFVVGCCGKIYVNLVGKRPQGIVQPGREYEELREQLIQEALTLRHPATGENVVQRVYRREEIFQGPHFNDLPDLLVEPMHLEYMPFGDVDFASNRVVEPILGQTGTHRMEGMLVMNGKGLKAGTVLQDAKIIDLAPTILYAMGQPVPSDMDGRVLTEAFEPQFLAQNAIEYAAISSSGKMTGDGYSRQEEEQIRERLRAMGYVA